jgi:hypothetical protein
MILLRLPWLTTCRLVPWAMLLPVDSVNIKNKDGLNQFTFGNIPGNSQVRYAAHLILAWLGTFWVMYNIKKDMRNFVENCQPTWSTLFILRLLWPTRSSLLVFPASFWTRKHSRSCFNTFQAE